MTDVFISYARSNRAAAEALAERLSGLGLTVWWDTELVAGEQFRAAIEEQLRAARAIVVLWSPDAVASRFVVDEADVAAATGKLISVLVDGFTAHQTPIGFRSYQAIPLADERGLDRALQRRGLQLCKPQATDAGRGDATAADAPAVQSADAERQYAEAREEQAWKFVMAKREKRLVKDFLNEFPNSKYATEAALRRTQLSKLDNILIFSFLVALLVGTLSFVYIGLITATVLAIGSFIVVGVALFQFFGDPVVALDAQDRRLKGRSD